MCERFCGASAAGGLHCRPQTPPRRFCLAIRRQQMLGKHFCRYPAPFLFRQHRLSNHPVQPASLGRAQGSVDCVTHQRMLEARLVARALPRPAMRDVGSFQNLERLVESVVAEFGQAADQLQVEDPADRRSNPGDLLRVRVKPVEFVLHEGA